MDKFRVSSIDEIKELLAYNKNDMLIELNKSINGSLHIEDNKNRNIVIDGNNYEWSGVNQVILYPKKYSDNIYFVCLEKGLNILRVWIDNEKYILARFPNVDTREINQVYTTLDIAMEKFKNCKKSKVAYLRGLHENEWGGNAYILAKENGDIKEKWIGNNNRGNRINKSKVILENVFRELDNNNEFYYDKEDGRLYFYNDRFIEKEILLEYSICDSLIEIKKSDSVTLKNLRFTKTDRSMFKGEWHRYLRSDWAYNYLSTISIDNSKNILVEECEFIELGNNAICVLNNSENIGVKNSIMTRSATNGVLILGDKESTYATSSWFNDNHVNFMESEDKCGARSDNYPKNVVVDNCIFSYLGNDDLQCAGVCVSLAHNVTIKNSRFETLSRAGVNIAENAFGGHKILSNIFIDCVRETGDHGPFNSWGRDRFWSLKGFNTTGKHGKIKRKYALCDMLDRNQIIDNIVVGKKGFGIDLDDGSTAYDITHNLCVGVGIKLREGFDRVVDNNVIINAPFDYHCAYYQNNDIIKNNIVYNDRALIVYAENRGSNANFSNNIWIDKNSKSNDRFKEEKTTTLEDLHNANYDFEGIQNLSNLFVKLKSIDLKSYFNNEKKHVIEKKVLGMKYSNIDESIRTIVGANGYDGVYIKDINILSRLYFKGVRKNDVILSINNEKVDIDNFRKMKNNIHTITIIRKQQEKTLNF